jgi:flagellar protein FliO/FliZ
MITQSAWIIASALAVIVALILTAKRLFQAGVWRSSPRTARTLVVRESIALDPRRRVHLVQCGQRQVVLLTGGAQDLVVGWMQDL